MLNVLAEARGYRLDEGDVRVLCSCFDVQRYLDRLPLAAREPTVAVDDNVTEEMTVLALTVEQLLGNSALASLGLSFIQRISRTAFPHNLVFAVTAAARQPTQRSASVANVRPTRPFHMAAPCLPRSSPVRIMPPP